MVTYNKQLLECLELLIASSNTFYDFSLKSKQCTLHKATCKRNTRQSSKHTGMVSQSSVRNPREVRNWSSKKKTKKKKKKN